MFNWLLCSCFVTVVSLFFHIYFTIHCRTHLPSGNLIHRPSLRVIWTMVKLSCKPSCKLSSKPLSKPSGSPGVYADDTASNTSHFFWSNCIICVSCIICANCIISTYCLNSPSISTFSKLSPSIIKAIGTYTLHSMLSPQYLTTRLGRRDGDRHEQNGT